MQHRATLFLVAFTMVANADVVTFECDLLPQDAGWELRLADTFGANTSLQNGWLVQFVDLPDGWPGPLGNAEFYRRSLAEFANAEDFFVEWRAETDAPSSILDRSGVPVVVSAFGSAAANYHTTVTDSRVQLFRDTGIALVFVDIAPGVPHTYRIELYRTDSYTWSVDGEIVDTGVPEGPYPNVDSMLIWGAQRHTFDATTHWDYVRFGRIPVGGSGDFESDEDVDGRDFYFFQECLSNDRPGINGGPDQDAGPGCRFADFDDDADVDLRDFAEFQLMFSGGE